MVVVIDAVTELTKEAVLAALDVNDVVLVFDRVTERVPVEEIVDVLLSDELALIVLERIALLEIRGVIDKLGVPVLVRDPLVLDVNVGVCVPLLDALEVNDTDFVENDLGVDIVDLVNDIVGVGFVLTLTTPVFDTAPDFVRITEIVFVAEFVFVTKVEGDSVTETVPVLVKERLMKAVPVTVFVPRLDPDDVIETVDVFDCEMLFVGLVLAVGVRDRIPVKDCVLVPPLDGLIEDDAERVLVTIAVTVAVPDALIVFDDFIVRDGVLDPVDVFDDVIVGVPVEVFRVVPVRLGDKDVLGDPVEVFEAGPLLDKVGDPVEVFEGLIEKVIDGLAVAVFDVEIEVVDVRLPLIVRVVVVEPVPDRVKPGVIEVVVDPVIVRVEVIVFVEKSLIYEEKEG